MDAHMHIPQAKQRVLLIDNNIIIIFWISVSIDDNIILVDSI